MTIPCLTLTQPWASLIALSSKKIETRSWSTKFRGPLAIHAGKHWSADDRELCNISPFDEALAEYNQGWGVVDPGALPRGAVLGIVNLHKVGRIGRGDGAVTVQGLDLPVLGDELAFGNYEPGRYAWVLTNAYRFSVPIPAKGALGLWRWEPPAALWLPEWAA